MNKDVKKILNVFLQFGLQGLFGKRKSKKNHKDCCHKHQVQQNIVPDENGATENALPLANTDDAKKGDK